MSELADRVRGDPSRTTKKQKAEDAALRQAVQTARAWHMPWSVFCGRKQVTTHALDGAGHVVRSETELWTGEDREIALALADYEADLCPGCGHPLSETTKRENSHRFVPRPPIRCHRCLAADIGAKAHKDDDHPSSLLFPIELEDEPTT